MELFDLQTRKIEKHGVETLISATRSRAIERRPARRAELERRNGPRRWARFPLLPRGAPAYHRRNRRLTRPSDRPRISTAGYLTNVSTCTAGRCRRLFRISRKYAATGLGRGREARDQPIEHRVRTDSLRRIASRLCRAIATEIPRCRNAWEPRYPRADASVLPRRSVLCIDSPHGLYKSRFDSAPLARHANYRFRSVTPACRGDCAAESRVFRGLAFRIENSSRVPPLESA